MLRLGLLPVYRLSPLNNAIRNLAAPVGGKVVAGKTDKSFVSSEAEKLATHACINFYVQGDEPGPKIKPDSEYPDWLFNLDLSTPKEFEDLDKDVDGWLYWRAMRKRQISQNRRIEKLKLRFLALQKNPKAK